MYCTLLYCTVLYCTNTAGVSACPTAVLSPHFVIMASQYQVTIFRCTSLISTARGTGGFLNRALLLLAVTELCSPIHTERHFRFSQRCCSRSQVFRYVTPCGYILFGRLLRLNLKVERSQNTFSPHTVQFRAGCSTGDPICKLYRLCCQHLHSN